MPSTSKKQHNFMAAIANNPSFAKKVGIPQSVGKDFSAADKGKTFKKGGATMMNKKAPNAMSAMMARRRMGAGMAPSAPPAMPPQAPAPMGMNKGGMAGMAKTRKFEGGGKVRTLQDAMADHYPNAERKNVKDDAALEENFDNAKKQISEKDYASAAVSGAKGVGHGLRSFARRVPMVPGAVFNEARIGAIKGAREMVNRKNKDTEAGFKKGGMPMKDGKPAFMKKFAKGGGIESRGKTKGTIIRMAAGGSVSARADGIAQRGKTRC